jgi:hypothetical protein
MIDIHMHIGRLYHELKRPFRASDALRFMDENGIEKAAILPIESPEETDYYVTTDYVIRVCARHPDRLIPFCNMDPRRRSADLTTDFHGILREYRERGCRGLGELMCGLWMDDPRMQKIYEACGALGMPIIFHLDALRDTDEKGLPRYEAMVKRFPQTIFVGHGPHFWAEMSADVKEEDFGAYPSGPIKRPGAVERLLSAYPNACADLSAGSGYNALTRDPEFGPWFLETFQDKLLFGTDKLKVDQDTSIIGYLREAPISREAYEKIAWRNALRIMPE